MRYLLTGGAGFVGSHLADVLTTRGDHVLILDDLSTGRRENIEHLVESELVEFVEGSVLDADLVDECMRSVDACLHLASPVGVKLVVSQPLDSLQRNVRGNDIVISSAAAHGCKLLFTSTSEVYGKNSQGALSEDSDRVLGSPFMARWSYATAKAFGEALAHGHWRQNGVPMIVVRLFNTVGPRQSGAYGMVLPRFVRQALVGEDLTVYGNGTQSRCFGHVLDTVHAIGLLLESDGAPGNVYNVGSTTEIPIVELARRVIERAGSDSKVRLVPYREAYDAGFEDLGRRKPDTTAIEELTGWAPTRTVDEAIDDVIAYEQSSLSARNGNLRLAG
ncbi:MAG: GDP-mannose 4,6-dehydratase [Actinomycetota bacterium]|nr:GDP-mannose 4,6-dehydratase [Actinomycetota bacterium]